jgi:hypothetical protein
LQSLELAIPTNFRGQEVPVWIESDEYEVVDAGKNQRLASPALNLTVKEKIKHYKIAGIISGYIDRFVALWRDVLACEDAP